MDIHTYFYKHKGRLYSINIPAESHTDAQERLASIRGTLLYTGRASSLESTVEGIIAQAHNLFADLKHELTELINKAKNND